jgi:Phage portal protein, SPP1 Gp6-like
MQIDNLNFTSASLEVAKAAASKIKADADNARSSLGINLQKNVDLYNNIVSKYFTQRFKESLEIFEYRKANPAKSNFVRFVVDLSAKYLYGRATKVRRDFGKNVETSEKATKLIKDTGLHQVMYDAAKKAAVCGEQVVRLVAVDRDTKEQPPEGIATANTIPTPVLLNPLKTWTHFNPWGKLDAVYMQYEVYDFARQKNVIYNEFVTESSRVTWADDPGALTPSIVPNIMPLTTEFVVLVNNGDRISDIEDIRDMSVDIVEAYTDMKHFHARHGWPQLLSEVDLSNVAHSPNHVWELLSDIDDGKKVTDRVAYLTWDGKMKEAYEYASRIERNLFILSNTARISTGDLEAIGQLRSGAALTVAHSVAIHKTHAKQIVWEKNEKAMLGALLRFTAYLQDSSVDSMFPDLEITITYPTDFVPGDELQRVQIRAQEIQNGLASLSDLLKERHPELSESEIETLKDLIIEEQGLLVDSIRKFQSETVGVSGTSGTSSQKSAEQT